MIKRTSKNVFDLQFVENARCEGEQLYPYHPLLIHITINKETYLATRHYQTIAILVITNKISRSYNLDNSGLPPSPISALQFVAGQYIELNPDPSSLPLYLLVGYIHGFMILIRCQGPFTTVIRRFNKQLTQQPSNLSKTFSFFNTSKNGNSQTPYSPWQKSPIIKIINRKDMFSYLHRNSIIVIVSSFAVQMGVLQNAFEEIKKQEGKRNRLTVGSYIGKEWQLVASKQGAIIEFSNNISTYHLGDQKLYVANFIGQLLIFQRATLSCLNKITVGVAIKSITYCFKFLIMCLQDDSVQLIEQTTSAFLNVLGHKSFTSQAQIVDLEGMGLTLFTTSFDGSFSLTKLPSINSWSSMKKRVGNNLHQNNSDIYFDLVFPLSAEGEQGIGTFVIVRDMIITATLDNLIKIYRLVTK